MVDICLNVVLTAERDMAFSEEAWILECRMSCLQGVSGFLQASQFFFYEVLSEKKWKSDIETVSLGHWQEKNQGLLPLLRKVKKENHTMNSLVVGNGAQWWLTCLAHSAPAAAAPSAGGSPRGLWSVPVHAGDVQT